METSPLSGFKSPNPVPTRYLERAIPVRIRLRMEATLEQPCEAVRADGYLMKTQLLVTLSSAVFSRTKQQPEQRAEGAIHSVVLVPPG